MKIPETNGRGYIPLSLLLKKKSLKINKADVAIIEGKIIIEDRAVENVSIIKKGVIIHGEHYTSRQSAIQIGQHGIFYPGEDDFIYFIEAGLNITDRDLIKQALGADDAGAVIRCRTGVIPIERIWIKTERKFPYLKIAIEGGLYIDEIVHPLEYEKI